VHSVSRIFTNATWIQRTLSKNIDKAVVVVVLHSLWLRHGFSSLREQQRHKSNLIVRFQILIFRIQYNAVFGRTELAGSSLSGY